MNTAKIHTLQDAQNVIRTLIEGVPYFAVEILGGDVTGMPTTRDMPEHVRFRFTGQTPVVKNRQEAAEYLLKFRDEFNAQVALRGKVTPPQEGEVQARLTIVTVTRQNMTTRTEMCNLAPDEVGAYFDHVVESHRGDEATVHQGQGHLLTGLSALIEDGENKIMLTMHAPPRPLT